MMRYSLWRAGFSMIIISLLLRFKVITQPIIIDLDKYDIYILQKKKICSLKKMAWMYNKTPGGIHDHPV